MSRRGGPDKKDDYAEQPQAPHRHNEGPKTCDTTPSAQIPSLIVQHEVTLPSSDLTCWPPPQASERNAMSPGPDDERLPVFATVLDERDVDERDSWYSDTPDIPCSMILHDRRIQLCLLILITIITGLTVSLVLSITKSIGATQTLSSWNGGQSAQSKSPQSVSSFPFMTPTGSTLSSNEPSFSNQNVIDLVVSTGLHNTTAADNAMKWVLGYSNISNYTDARILQKFAIASLYYVIQGHGPPFLWESEFDVVDDECSWTGVACNADAQIVSISITEMGLIGTIPPQLSLLTTMSEFSIWSNKFYGEVPRELAAWTDISGVWMGGNDYTGTFPSNIFLLTNLRYLSMDWMNFNAGPIPTQLLELRNLKKFSITSSQRTGAFPEELYDMPYLESIECARNQISGTLSTRIGKLRYLYELDIGDNRLEGTVPSEVGRLFALTYLDIWKNNFSGTIPDVSQLTLLETLDLSMNRFKGPFPESITYFTNLRSWLGIADNLFTGTISTGIGRLSDMTGTVDFGGNQLAGNVPTEIGLLTSITSLKLDRNILTGILPSQIGNLVNLQELYLSHNPSLGGPIPLELANLTAATTLLLFDNAWTGSVPSGVCQLSQGGTLQTISVNCNLSCTCCHDYCF